MSKKFFFRFTANMNISFGTSFIIKSDQLILPKDSAADRKHISDVLKEFSKFMNYPCVNAVWKDYSVEFKRTPSRDKFVFSLKPTVKQPTSSAPVLPPIIFKYKSLKSFNALECFNELSYSLAARLNKISCDLPLGTDIFRHVVERLYNVRL